MLWPKLPKKYYHFFCSASFSSIFWNLHRKRLTCLFPFHFHKLEDNWKMTNCISLIFRWIFNSFKFNHEQDSSYFDHNHSWPFFHRLGKIDKKVDVTSLNHFPGKQSFVWIQYELELNLLYKISHFTRHIKTVNGYILVCIIWYFTSHNDNQ